MNWLRMRVSPRAAAEAWTWRYGWAGPLAVAVALAALVLYFAVVQPQRERAAQLHASIARARSSPAAGANPPASAPWADVSAAIAVSAPADQLVARMVQLARRQDITLPLGEYQQRPSGDPTIVQMQVTQPVRATYPQLRRYVESVLRSIPNASLDQLGARRENVGQLELEARLRWSLWLPRAQAKTAAPAQEQSTP